jgi:hypothetical protein
MKRRKVLRRKEEKMEGSASGGSDVTFGRTEKMMVTRSAVHPMPMYCRKMLNQWRWMMRSTSSFSRWPWKWYREKIDIRNGG